MTGTETKSNFLAWCAAVFTVAVWAETFVSTKILLNIGLLPPDIFFYRFLLAYVFIWIISPKRLFSGSVRDELSFLGLGITGGSLYFLAENTALEYSTASNVAILVGTAPLLTALIVGAFYKEERMSGKQIAGSFIAFAGMVLVVLNGKFNLHLNPKGDLFAIGAAAVWGFYSLILRNLSGRYDTVFITRKVFAYGLLSMLLYFLFVRPLNFDLALMSRPVVWGNLLYLGLVASLLCFVLWNWALSRLGTVRTTNIIYGQCFFTMLIASIVLGERITPMAVAGTLILTSGMLLAVRNQ